jgi:Putative Zn-dependent protease, contains TPR repeats
MTKTQRSNRAFTLAVVIILLVSQMVTTREAASATADGNIAATNKFVEELSAADEFFSQGQYKKARTAYQALISLAASNPEGYLGLGRVELLEGNTPAALSHLEKAVKLAPQSADAHFILGSSLLSTGNPNRAFAELTTAQELDPQRPEIQYKLTQARALRDAKGLEHRDCKIQPTPSLSIST